MKVELFIQLCVNGRPLWLKTKVTKPENTLRMTDREYDKIISAAEKELSLQVTLANTKEKEKAPVVK